MAFRIVDEPPQPAELLYAFKKGDTCIRCELVDRVQDGIEARLLHNGELQITSTFAPRDFTIPRAAAIQWAEAERKAIEDSADTWY